MKLTLPLVILATALDASAVVSIDWVSVGDVGNAGDTTGYGSVAYNYQIAKNETTVAQYCEFLNAVAKTDTFLLYHANMSSTVINRSGEVGAYSYSIVGDGSLPINWVSWYDAARFCNWLSNGQPVGDQTETTTEDGSYTTNGATGGPPAVRNAGATIVIPTMDEWYKAAYFDPSKGGVGGYWQYATQSDTLAGNTPTVADSANYDDGDSYGGTLPVGSYGPESESYYGTNDQTGNAREITATTVVRGLGGYYLSTDPTSDSVQALIGGGHATPVDGFRLAYVPEPSVAAIAALSAIPLLRRRRWLHGLPGA